MVYALSGHISAEHVSELQGMLESESDGVALVLDLSEIRRVDREAVDFLAICEASGTALENCPPYVREWITRRRDG
jgi:ABC-type transporter Mla MlaB component